MHSQFFLKTMIGMELYRPRSSPNRISIKFRLPCQDRIESIQSWLTISKLLAYTNGNVAVLQGVLDKRKDVVVKFGDAREIMEEYTASQHLFAAKLPNMLKFYCMFTCKDEFNEVLHRNYATRPYVCIGNNEQPSISCIIMPYYDMGSMNTYPWKKSQLATFKNVLKQICYALCYAFVQTGFVHSDLHSGNVLLRQTKKQNMLYGEVDLLLDGKYAIIMDFQKPLMNDPERFLVSLERIIYTSCTSDGSDIMLDCDMLSLKTWFMRYYSATNTWWNTECANQLGGIIDAISLRYVKSEIHVHRFVDKL